MKRTREEVIDEYFAKIRTTLWSRAWDLSNAPSRREAKLWLIRLWEELDDMVGRNDQ